MTIIRHYTHSDTPFHPEIVPLLVSIVSLVLLLTAPEFRYQSGQAPLTAAWTASASQLAHLDVRHWMLNMAGLWLVSWGLKPWRAPRQDALFLGAGALGVAAGLLLTPQVLWYCGLSGALHGLFCGLILHLVLTDRRAGVHRVGIILVIGLAIKLVAEDPVLVQQQPMLMPLADILQALTSWDRTAASVPGSASVADSIQASQPVLYAAHRWGAAAGAVAGLISGIHQRFRQTG